MLVAAIILGIFIYGGTDGWLKWIAPLFLGLFGIAAYTLPILLAGAGIYLIAANEKRMESAAIAGIVIILFSILMITHISAMSESLSQKYFKFISLSYSSGTHGVGGGAVAAIFARALTAILGSTGSIVLLTGIIIVTLLIITGFSFNGFRESLSEKRNYESSIRRRDRYPSIDDEANDGFIAHSGKPLTAGDYQPTVQTGDEAEAEEVSPQPNEGTYRSRKRTNSAAITDENPARRSRTVQSCNPEDLTITPDIDQRKRSFRRSDRGSTAADDLTLFPRSGDLNRSRKRSGSKNTDDLKIGESFVPKRSRIHNYAPVEFGALDSDMPAANDKTSESAAEDLVSAEPIIQDDFAGQADEPIIADDEPSFILETESTDSADDTINDTGESEIVVTNTEDPESIVIDSETGEVQSEPAVSKPTNTISQEIPPELREYRRPPLTLLKKPEASEHIANSSAGTKAKALMDALASFGVSAKLISICEGPRVIRFEIQLAQGIRVNKVTVLKDDLGVALAAAPVRIEAPIPGKTTIGIEIPNGKPAKVLLREVLESSEFRNAKSPLIFALGKDITGNVVTADLAAMPHMLVAGRTGTGKSVCINSIILSIAYRSSPKEVRMILIDPKVVEFKMYAPLPHLFCPVVTDKNRAAGALRWATKEMDKRYQEMGSLGVRGIDRYNELQANEDDRWPRLVIIIDELSDLMLVAPKDVEESILRISQLGRACGIHLIVATQRPSVDVITGTIKANLPSKIAFAVASYTDSKVILDTGGAETLLGKGDMIFAPDGSAKPIRIQGSLVTDTEVESVMSFFAGSEQPIAEQDQDMIKELNAIPGVGEARNDMQEDEELPDAVRVVIESGKASTSLLQRRLRVGYAKASRLMDIMEQKGYVGPADGAKPRNVLITASAYQEIFGDDRPLKA